MDGSIMTVGRLFEILTAIKTYPNTNDRLEIDGERLTQIEPLDGDVYIETRPVIGLPGAINILKGMPCDGRIFVNGDPMCADVTTMLDGTPADIGVANAEAA